MSLPIWRLVAIFLYVTSAAWCQGYQQPNLHYVVRESHRHFRSAGNEPTTITPASGTLKEVPVENQTVDSDVTNSTQSPSKSTRDINDMFPSDVEFIDDADVVTLSDGSITLVTDKPEVNTTTVPNPIPSLVSRDTSKSVVEPSPLGRMDGQNASIEGDGINVENSTDEAVKMLKRRQAPQFFQLPVQPQQIPLAPQFQFQPLPMQKPGLPTQFKVPSQFLFSAQPGQPAIFFQLPPADQARFAPDQVRFVPSNVPHVVLQQQANAQQGQASISKQLPPKLSLNPVPLPTSTPANNATNMLSSNSSQVNAVKTREAHANNPMPKWQPPMVSLKPFSRPNVPPDHPNRVPLHAQTTLAPPSPPAPFRAAQVQVSSPFLPQVQRPMVPQVAPQVMPSESAMKDPMMMPQVPAQPMVRPRLQGQQGSPPQGQLESLQTFPPFPRGMDVSPAQFPTQGNRAPQAVPGLNQQLNIQMQPTGSPTNQPLSPFQTASPAGLFPQQLRPPVNEQPPPFRSRMDLPPQPQTAQRSESPVNQFPQQRPPPMGAPVNQPVPIDTVQRSGPNEQRLPQQMPTMMGFPMDQPPTQSAQRSESSMNQPPPQMASPRGFPVSQPPQFQAPNGQPMNQPMGTPMNQPMGTPMNQPMGTPMNQPMGTPMNQPMGSPLNQQPPPSQMAPRMGFPGTQQSPPAVMEPAMPPNRAVDGSTSPISQLSQRSVHDDHDHKDSMSRERHMRKRSIGMHHMTRRQMDAVPYPSKEAYDSYVVNNYHDQYEEIYPMYYYDAVDTPTTVSTVYMTTTTSPRVQYSAPLY